MEELFKKVLYAGAGLAAVATEKIQTTVDELVEKGKISDKEGKKIIEEFFEKTDAKKNEFEEKFAKVTQEVTEKLGYVKKEEVDSLMKRIDKLEAKLAAEAKKAAK